MWNILEGHEKGGISFGIQVYTMSKYTTHQVDHQSQVNFIFFHQKNIINACSGMFNPDYEKTQILQTKNRKILSRKIKFNKIHDKQLHDIMGIGKFYTWKIKTGIPQES